eukprot:COSAG06_NODE_1254_length_10093_cov_2.384231_8_plen_63_part_00
MEINARRRDAVNCQQRRGLPLFSESTSRAFAGIASQDEDDDDEGEGEDDDDDDEGEDEGEDE